MTSINISNDEIYLIVAITTVLTINMIIIGSMLMSYCCFRHKGYNLRKMILTIDIFSRRIGKVIKKQKKILRKIKEIKSNQEYIPIQNTD